MSLVAAIRPDHWNLPLLLHVFGAMILVGGHFAAGGALAYARRRVSFLRLGYLSLLAVALPGWLLMRLGAQWIYSAEGWNDLPDGDNEPDWLTTGTLIADGGGVLLLVSLVSGGVGLYRLRTGKSGRLLKSALALSLVLLPAYLVAVWAMAGKVDY